MLLQEDIEYKLKESDESKIKISDDIKTMPAIPKAEPIIVVFDYDSTLYHESGFIFPKETKKCFQQLHSLGVQIKIATYRDSTDPQGSNLKKVICTDLDGLLGTEREYLTEEDIYIFQDAKDRKKEWLTMYNDEAVLALVQDYITDKDLESVTINDSEAREFAETCEVEKLELNKFNKNPLLFLIKSDVRAKSGGDITLDKKNIIFTDDRKNAIRLAKGQGFTAVGFEMNIEKNKPESAEFLAEIISIAKPIAERTISRISSAFLEKIYSATIKEEFIVKEEKALAKFAGQKLIGVNISNEYNENIKNDYRFKNEKIAIVQTQLSDILNSADNNVKLRVLENLANDIISNTKKEKDIMLLCWRPISFLTMNWGWQKILI